MRRLTILSGGAAQGLVTALTSRFTAETGAEIEATYGAVGAMRAKLIGGTPVDLLILTATLIEELTRSGHVRAGSGHRIGSVETAIAVRSGALPVAIGNRAELSAALSAADAIYFPDPELATAGIHFTKVLDALGMREALAGRLKTFPNGNAAMQAMAAAGGQPIGCTQATEIIATPGVALVGPLPGEFRLATVYTCGVTACAREPELAAHMAALLTAPEDAENRCSRFGFDLRCS
ncbi:MAG TPA: substrate-binding domain-containing protein [Hyphomicrobiaceae bacterium]|nr:substrate-binding domain-containing protein [Hyphomicrobiaceae bacterium]